MTTVGIAFNVGSWFFPATRLSKALGIGTGTLIGATGYVDGVTLGQYRTTEMYKTVDGNGYITVNTIYNGNGSVESVSTTSICSEM